LRKKNNYWKEEQEQAVRDYRSASQTGKSIIYNKHLKEQLSTMFDSIYNRYGCYSGNYSAEEIKVDCITKVLLKLEKYDADRATAFSFCGTIVRNFLHDFSKAARREVKNTEWLNESEDGYSAYELDIAYEPDYEYFESEELVEADKRQFRNTLFELVGEFLKSEGYDEGEIETFLSWFYEGKAAHFQAKGRSKFHHHSMHQKLLNFLQKEDLITQEELNGSLMRKKRKGG
jgi:DNA-directed RNA polymerase specialized sigma24 family protein